MELVELKLNLEDSYSKNERYSHGKLIYSILSGQYEEYDQIVKLDVQSHENWKKTVIILSDLEV